jgi:hypothetical protein
MKMSLRELAEARAELSGFFERLWPDPACPCPEPQPRPADLDALDLDALEQRYRRAQRTVEALRQSAGWDGTGSACVINRCDQQM